MYACSGKRVAVWTLFCSCLLLALAAWAQAPRSTPMAVGGGGTNTTTYTTSTHNVYHDTTINVTQQVNTFLVELKARMQGGSYVFDQTYNVAFSDPTVQAALAQAENLLTNAGATSFAGPTQLSSTQSTSSATSTSEYAVTATDVSYVTSLYIGPQTIMVGDNQATPFSIPAGGMDIDTVVTSDIYQTRTTTTTNTTLTSQVYEIDGIASGTPCTYAVSTPNLAVAAAGGIMALTIRTDIGCTWSITGLPAWLTVGGDAQRTGSANVTLTAAASSGAARSTLLSVGGVSVPVRQLDSLACAGSASCTMRALTHVAYGGEWTTDLVAIGSGMNASSFSVGFHGDSGAAVALPFTGGLGDLSTLADIVPPQGRKDYAAANPALSDQGGWGLVTAEDSLAMQAVFRRHTPDNKYYEAAVPTSGGYSRFMVPFDATTFAPTGAEMFTGFAIDNLNPSETAHITCTARDHAGTIVPGAVTIPSLGPLGHYTGFAFPLLAGKRGTFDCSADTLLSALALRAIGGDAFSTLPVIVK